MQLSQQPTQLTLPFTASGGKNTIPVASQIGITPGAASYTDGFPPLTRTNVAAGGVPPFGLDMNGILYSLSATDLWSCAGAGYTYNNSFATNSNILGYPAAARIARSDGKGYWINTLDGNQVDPESVTPGAAATAGWVPDVTTGVTTVTLSNANVTLTPVQYGRPLIIYSGTLTGNVNLIVPGIAAQWTFVNSTTGNFTVTIKTATGIGMVLNQGSSAILYCDGTNVNNSSSGQVTGVAGDASNVRIDVSSASTSTTISADEIIVETSLGGVRYCVSNLSAGINLATTGVGGMDTGSAPVSSYVAVYVIYNPSTRASGLLATNAALIQGTIYGGANLPAGYTASALISVWPTDASSRFVIGHQKGRTLTYIGVNILSSSSVTGGLSTLAISSAVPANAKYMSVDTLIQSTAASVIHLDMWAAGTQAGHRQCFCTTGSAGAGIATSFDRLQLAAPQTTYYATSNTAGTPTFSLSVTGYEI